MSYCSVCKQNHDGSGCPMHYDQDMSIYDEAMTVSGELKRQITVLTAENKRLREALCIILNTSPYKKERVDYPSDVIKEIHQIAQDALKQGKEERDESR